MQVLNLYAKMMAWLGTADPTVCVQTNTWTAAVLQLAMEYHKVLLCTPAIYTCVLPYVTPHGNAAPVSALS